MIIELALIFLMAMCTAIFSIAAIRAFLCGSGYKQLWIIGGFMAVCAIIYITTMVL